MNGGMMKTSGFAIAAVAAALMSTSALAADLGGNCCADLEERIAELEATTVRKGNRKVSLQISGYVSHHVMWWDDGVRSDTYIGDGGNYGSRWRFRGEAKINAELSAGFLYEYTAFANSISSVNQGNGGDDLGQSGNGLGANSGTPGNLALRDSTVWLRHSRLGMVKIGHGSTTNDNLVLIDLANLGGSATPDVALYGGGMRMADAATVETYTAFTWTNMIAGHESWDNTRRNHVLYETPSLHGFTLQAAVAEDNYWDVALRYAGEFNGVRVAFGIGYQEDTEFNAPAGFVANQVTCTDFCSKKATDFKGSGSILHTATGLFVTAAFGQRDMDNAFAVGDNRDGSFWWVASGLARNFFGIGTTTIFGEYGNHSDMLTMVNAGVLSSDATTWGLGINQTIDAAAMDIFLTYKHFEGDFRTAAGITNVRDLDMVILGTRVNF